MRNNADLVAPRIMKPWQKIEDLKEDGSFKETKVKSMANSITEAKTLNETDARDFDDLLEGIPNQPTQSNAGNSKKTTNSQTPSTSTATPSTSTSTSTSEPEAKTAQPKLKSVIVRVEEKKKVTVKEEPVFVVKRDWAWKAETDEEREYVPNRRTNCLESIKDLMAWTKKNVVDYEPGKLFETLLSSDELFNNPGLQDHPAADVYLNKINERHNAGRKSNSFEVGFRCFARKVFLTVFKDKAYGLVNRNFSGLRNWTRTQIMSSLGKFMDKLLEKAERVEDDFDGDVRYELDRFEVEKLKDEYLPFTTSNKAGSYEIEIYTKDVSIGENEWLLLLLKHASFAWENVTMMRAKLKSIRTRRLNLHFQNLKAEEYHEGISLLNELLRNPNTLAPGNWSRIFM